MNIIYIVLGIALILAAAIVIAKVGRPANGAQRLIGESGIVLSDIALDQNGVIKLNGKEYTAASEHGEEIPKNCKAVVKKVSSDRLYVERIKF